MSETAGDGQRIDVAGHQVYPEQRSQLPCPVCDGVSEVYYLGSRSSLTAGDEPRETVVSGWVCPDCESTLEVPDRDLMGDSDVEESDVIVRGDQP
ncbi:hypothetical protein [Halorubrum sp. LN27]|uniref:hypothetical protein n=1 Tax=Halorubrum sp. LN27 TaxID=2801032 RepID=UPI00190B0953|nr:hypothetical protein [Halorubrum sp. LN27]